MSPSIRMATPADLEAIMRIEHESFTAPRWSESLYRDMLFTGRDRAFPFVGVAEIDGEVAGFIAVRVIEGIEAHIESIATTQHRQRLGVGRSLVDWALVQAGPVPCLLEVRESNAAALGLYRGMGFAKIGRRKRYYTNPIEDALVLLRDRRADG